jgi:hypothetical protein
MRPKAEESSPQLYISCLANSLGGEILLFSQRFVCMCVCVFARIHLDATDEMDTRFHATSSAIIIVFGVENARVVSECILWACKLQSSRAASRQTDSIRICLEVNRGGKYEVTKEKKTILCMFSPCMEYICTFFSLSDTRMHMPTAFICAHSESLFLRFEHACARTHKHTHTHTQFRSCALGLMGAMYTIVFPYVAHASSIDKRANATESDACRP